MSDAPIIEISSPINVIKQKIKYVFSFIIALFPLALIIFFVFTNGEFGNFYADKEFYGFVLILIATLSWLLFFSNSMIFSFEDTLINRVILILTIILIAVLPFTLGKHWWWCNIYGRGAPPVISNYNLMIYNCMILLVLLVTTYLLNWNSKIIKQVNSWILELSRKIRFSLIFIIAIFIKILTIKSFPAPSIDVFDVLMLGPSALLEGLNPYDILYTQLYSYIADYFPYPPGILLLLAPFRAFSFDIRYFFVLVDILIAIVIYIAVKKKNSNFAELFAIIPLFLPWNLFFIHYAWTDMLSVLFIAILLFFGGQEKAFTWRPFLIGFMMTIKQSLWLFLPFYMIFALKKGKKGVVEFLKFSIVFSLIMLPFFIWNPEAFLNDIWIFHTKYIRYESLTFNSYFWRYPGIITEIPLSFFLILYVILLGVFYFLDDRKIEIINYQIIFTQATIIKVIRFGILAVFLFFIFGKLAFMNHYAMVIMTLYLLYIKISIDKSELRIDTLI